MRVWSLVVLVVPLLVVCARSPGQEAGPPDRARAEVAALASRALALRAARAFLVDGPAAPRPDLGAEDVLEVVDAPAHPLVGPCVGVALRRPGGELRLLVTVELARARPIALLQPERECHVRRLDAGRRRRDPEVVAAEAARRCVLSPEELERRARAFVARAWEDGTARRLERVREERRREGLVGDTFLFVERPRDGVALCMANLARVTVQPESGDVVAAAWTDVRVERPAPPAVEAARAEELARARDRGSSLGRLRAASLRILLPPAVTGPAAPRAVWTLAFEPGGAGPASARGAHDPEPDGADAPRAEVVVRRVDADTGEALDAP